MWSWPGGKTSVGLMGMFDADLDWGMMVEEVSAFEKLGGGTIVEVSHRANWPESTRSEKIVPGDGDSHCHGMRMVPRVLSPTVYLEFLH